MNINPKIEEIFANFEVDGNLIHIAFMQYLGKATTYLTYYTWSELPQRFYDDFHNSEICYGTIDIWSKNNFKPILEAVKEKLKQNNFTWTDNAAETFEPETGYFHVPVNFMVSNIFI